MLRGKTPTANEDKENTDSSKCAYFIVTLALKECKYTHGLTLMSLTPKYHQRTKIRVFCESEHED